MWRIKRFFENLYFYFFRKIRINDNNVRAYKLLTDSFNGSSSIVGALIVKVTHMLYKVREYSCEDFRYISNIYDLKLYKSAQDIISNNLAQLDKSQLIDIMRVDINPEEDDPKNEYLYRGYMDGSYYKIVEIIPKQKGFYKGLDIVNKELVNVEKPNYEYPLDKDNSKEIATFEYFNFNFDCFEKVILFLNNYILNNYGEDATKTVLYQYNPNFTCSLSPAEYKKLEPSVKKKVCGRIKAYHTLWEYRRELKRFYIFENFDDGSLYNLDNYENYIKDMSDSINKIFKENSLCWWI